MSIRKTLGAIVLSAAIGLSSCDNSGSGSGEKYLEGTVIKEAGTVTQSPRFGDPSYVLQIQTENGVYTVSVIYNGGDKTLEALSLAIEEGTRIRFAIRQFGKDRFSEDRIGRIYTMHDGRGIIVLNQE